MIIKSLKLHNFGVYAGDNEFVFEGKKPIVLIGGLNGRGKTTFLEAILLALYGPNSFAYLESDYKAYTQYLRSYVNRDAIDNLCWIELCFEMSFGEGKESYRIVRAWEGFSKRINETLTVYKDGEYSEFLTNNWLMFVENILPSALSNLFIFDGEKIAELAVDNTNEQLKKSIRSMLGISVLDVLKNDVMRNLKKANKDCSNDESTIVLNDLRNKKDVLALQVNELKDKRNNLQTNLDSDNSKLEMLIQMYSARGGIAAEKRQQTIQKKSDSTSELASLTSKLVELTASDLPFIMVKDLLFSIKMQAEDEHEYMILRKSINQLEELQKSFEHLNSNMASGSASFINYIKTTVVHQNVKQVYCLSDHALYQLSSLVENRIDESVKEANQIIKRKSLLEKKIGELDSYLNLDINSQELEELNEEIKKVESRIIKAKVEIHGLTTRISELESDLKEATNDFNKALETFLTNAEYQDSAIRTAKYSEMIIKVIDRYLVELQKRKAELLGTTITECYKKLASKKRLIENVKMDPDSLDYHYYSDCGKEIPKDSLSAGEKQVMIIAILWALAINSKQKLPVIIDTPLSRLDSHHRKTIIKKYFPNASRQTIILSTDSEVDKTYYQMMRDDVGDEYTLVYDENTKSTSIQKGYSIGKQNDY